MTDGRTSRAPRVAALAAAACAYFALLLFRYRAIPDGLMNDQAEELLRGLVLLAERRLEVLTLAVGNSAETLWLYVLGLSASVFGPSVLALVLPSALAAAATAALVTAFVVRRDPRTPAWVPFLLAAGSPWLFHYGRSGLRAITAPLFVALAALLLQRAQERPDRRGPFAAAGAVVGLSLYGYTSSRLLALALAIAFAVVLRRAGPERRDSRRAALAAAAGFGLASIPNAFAFAAHPVEFLVRGAYSVVGTAWGKVGNVLATVALPLAYPHRYRFIWGDEHVLDGVSASMSGSGVDPVPFFAGLLVVAGLVRALRFERDLAGVFLLATWGLTVVFLGPLGPSLTRLLLLAPVFVVWASGAVAELATTPRRRAAAAVILAALGVHAISGWFARLSDPNRPAREVLSPVQTAIGERARVLAAEGPAVAVVSNNGNVVRTLAFGTRTSVVEFRRRPFDYREVEAAFPARLLLVERDPVLDPYRPRGFVERPARDPRWRELAAAGPGGP